MNVGIPILSFLGILIIAGATATTGGPAVADLETGRAPSVAAAATDVGSHAGAGDVAAVIDPLYAPYLTSAGTVSGGFRPAPVVASVERLAGATSAPVGSAWSWDSPPPDIK